MKRLLLSTAALLILSAIPMQSQAQQPWLTDAERAKFEELRVTGSEALFNLDYDAARKNFKEMADVFPNYPAGPQFLADTLWTETLYETRKLQSSLYGSDSFYSNSEDK